MASAPISAFEASTVAFIGQGDLVMVALPDGGITDSTTLADYGAAQSLGQIVQDSSSWEGEDASTEDIRDEQGNIINAKPIAGTLGISFDIASTSAAMLKKFMVGDDLTAALIGASGAAWITGSTATAEGFGVNIPTFECGLLWVNDTKTRCLFFPKAKITANLAYSDGIFRIHASAIAEQVNSTHLKTAMMIEGAPAYSAGE